MSKSNPDDQPILTVGVHGPFSRQLLSDIARYQVQENERVIPNWFAADDLRHIEPPQVREFMRIEPQGDDDDWQL